jgi:tetratricopeptide (TPR) repeat protein
VRLRRAAVLAAAVWIALLCIATITRNNVMQDPIALWADTAAKSPQNWRAHSSYAEALLEVGRNDEAMRALEESVRLNPDVGSSRVELGQLYLRAGRLDDAEAVLLPATDQLEESVAAAAYQQLASLYENRGATAKAVDMLRAAVDRKPGWATLHVQLAQNYARAGFWYGAAGHYNTAIGLNSRLIASLGAAAAAANVRAAQNQLDEGNPDMAEHLLQEAMRYQPSDLSARHYLAVVYARRDDWDRAQGQLEALRQTLPDDPLLRDNLQRAHDHQQLIQPPLGK